MGFFVYTFVYFLTNVIIKTDAHSSMLQVLGAFFIKIICLWDVRSEWYHYLQYIIAEIETSRTNCVSVLFSLLSKDAELAYILSLAEKH